MKTLYTPGHSLLTDTLIMHGMARLLSWAGVAKCEIERVGERYVIRVKEDVGMPPYSGLLSLEDLKTMLEVYADKRIPHGVAMKKFSRIVQFNVAVIRSWINNLYEGLTRLDLREYETEDHIRKTGEGRQQRGTRTRTTLYLPMGAVFGKYSTNYYQASPLQYQVCLHCHTLATLGLLYGTGLALTPERYYYISVSPTYATLNEVVLFQRGIEDMNLDLELEARRVLGSESKGLKDVPPLAIVVYAFSHGETIHAFRNPVDILSWGIEVQKGGAVRVVEYMTTSGKKLLETVATIKLMVPEWPRIAQYIIAYEPVLLQKLAETVIFGLDPYEVVREYRRLARELVKYDVAREVGMLMLSRGIELAQVLVKA